jgi:hypothetical protein
VKRASGWDGLAQREAPAAAGLATAARTAVAFALALAAWDVWFLHPGVGAPEELESVFYEIARAGQTWPHWFRFSGGAWTRLVQAGLLAGPWDWHWIYLLNAAGFGLGAWGLWALATELGGPLAAACTLLLLLASPFPYLQLRTLFCYGQVPAAALGLALALRRPLGAWASLAVGALAALFWLDYDGWILVLPGAAAAWAWAPAGRRARFWPALAGLFLGLAVVLALSRPYLAEWWNQRQSQLPGPGATTGQLAGILARAQGYFLGSRAPLAMGLQQWPAFPWLGWPGLILALAWAPAWLWIWAAGGLLGLAVGGPFQEPNRVIAAWPALLLLSGLGTARLLDKVGALRPLPHWGLCLAPLLGFAVFIQAEGQWDGDIHGLSRRLLQAADFLGAQGAALGPPLDRVDQSFLERARPELRPRSSSAAPQWFLVPRTMADPQDPRWGEWRAFDSGPQSPSTWLLRPSPAAAALLGQAAGQISALPDFQSVPWPTSEALARLRASDEPRGNAWSWTVAAETRSRFALKVGRAQAGDLLPLLQGPCLDSAPLDEAAAALRQAQPQWAARFDARAAALRRPGARWDLALGRGGHGTKK